MGCSLSVLDRHGHGSTGVGRHMVEHKFGGPQTDFKLDVLRQYLAFFTTVLKRQDFELWYIDGFAGTGQRLVERIISHEEPLWRLGPPVIEHERVPGSSLIALASTALSSVGGALSSAS